MSTTTMNMNFRNLNLTLLMVLLFLNSCKKENTGGTNSNIVKYEITGNFTGKLIVIYNDNVNGNTTLNNVSLPFSKEITYPTNISGIGIGAQATIHGVAGQTATIKIYSGGTVVKTGFATAGSLGELVLPSIAYTF